MTPVLVPSMHISMQLGNELFRPYPVASALISSCTKTQADSENAQRVASDTEKLPRYLVNICEHVMVSHPFTITM